MMAGFGWVSLRWLGFIDMMMPKSQNIRQFGFEDSVGVGFPSFCVWPMHDKEMRMFCFTFAVDLVHGSMGQM